MTRAAGPYWEVDDPWAYLNGWIDRPFYMKQLEEQVEWWWRATVFAIEREQPDLLFSWVGAIDHVQHVFWGGIDSKFYQYKPENHDEYLELIRSVYRWVDRGVGEIRSVLSPDCILVALSDHGFHSISKYPFLTHHLHKAGLVEYLVDPQTGDVMVNPTTGEVMIDWSRTKAYPLPPGHSHIFVNLKGRDPDGIVEPEDYEKVQEAIIDALMAMRDPETGQQVVSLALKRQDARTVGIWHGKGWERVGDVIFDMTDGYCANPMVYPAEVRYPDGTRRVIANLEEFEPCLLNRHFTGYHLALPATECMHAVFLGAGPGFKQGCRLEEPLDVVDIAPTLATAVGMPIPRDAEGLVNHRLLDTEHE